MPWKEVTVSDSRKEFVTLAKSSSNFAELCRRFGISRKTGYKWLGRFEKEGPSGLEDRSRRPHHAPLQTPEVVEGTVLELRDQHPAWGGRKIRTRLQMMGKEDIPSASTITAILHRNGRIDPEESLKRTDWQRFEYKHPNHLWQMDFKGDFAIDTGRCHPLTMLDDHSRYNLLLRACPNQQTKTVRGHLITAFERYGLPLRMLMDRGSPWWGNHEYPHTPLTLWLIRLGIQICHGRPYHPQTQGKEERFHRTLKAELIHYRRFKDLNDCQKAFHEWRKIYNHERPHESLEMATPASRYQPSSRAYPSELPPIEYGPEDMVRKVQVDGIISFKGREVMVGKAFHGYPVAVRYTLEDGIFDVYFCHQKITRIDLTTPASGM